MPLPVYYCRLPIAVSETLAFIYHIQGKKQKLQKVAKEDCVIICLLKNDRIMMMKDLPEKPIDNYAYLLREIISIKKGGSRPSLPLMRNLPEKYAHNL